MWTAAPGCHLWARAQLLASAESSRELVEQTHVSASFLKDLGWSLGDEAQGPVVLKTPQVILRHREGW